MVRWGEKIKENTLSKWRTRYIEYAVLKGIIRSLSKNPSNASKLQQEFAALVDMVSLYATNHINPFIHICHIQKKNLSKVESFFVQKQQKFIKQYDLMMVFWKKRQTDKAHIVHGVIDGFKKLLAQLNEFETYAFLNSEGFRKIIKKYDKKLNAKTKVIYNATFEKCEFYKHKALKQMISEVSEIINHFKPSQAPRKLAIFELISKNEFFDNEDDDKSLFELLESGQTDKISQFFIHCVRSNDFEAAESIIDYYVENGDDGKQMLAKIINCTGYMGNTPLITCCAVSGSIKIAKLLIKNGADITLCNSYYRNALHVASQRGYNEMIKLILNAMKESKKSNVIVELDKDMHNALHLAIMNRKYMSCKLLLQFDPKIINQQNADGQTPLMVACGLKESLKSDAIKEFLSKMMDFGMQFLDKLNQRDWQLQSALHYACASGNAFVVGLLLKHNIDVFVFDLNGQSPLHICCRKGYLNVLKLICEHIINEQHNESTKKSDPSWKSSIAIWNHTDNEGRTPLHLCAAKGFDECTNYLLSIGANPNIVDTNVCNAHSYAFYCGNWNDECPKQEVENEEKSENTSDGNSSRPSPTPPRPEKNSISFMKRVLTKMGKKMGKRKSAAPKAFIDANVCIVKFRVQCATNSKQVLRIIGDCKELGDGDIAQSVRMHQNIVPDALSQSENDTGTESDENVLKDVSAPPSLNLLNSSFNANDEATTWICELALPKGSIIKYRYIICNNSEYNSSLQLMESLPSERSATIHSNMMIDDGVFGMTQSIPRHESYSSRLSQLAQITENESIGVSLAHSPTTNTLNFEDASCNETDFKLDGSLVKNEQPLYVQRGWLMNDCQLQLLFGFVTTKKKRPAVIVNNNIHIGRVLIRSGYINSNRYKGIHIMVSLPIKKKDRLKLYKFQSSFEQINALCSLEFEFFPRFGPAIAKCISLPSQILTGDSVGALTLPLISNESGLLIGEFNFEYRIIKPFKHKNCGSVLFKTFKNQERYTNSILIGHRGTGSHGSASLPGTRRTHIKENTILAFNAAKSFGADFVEFDVQLTKDNVPIIYHDFLFPVGPFQIPINKISFHELKAFNKSSTKSKISTDTNDIKNVDDPSAPKRIDQQPKSIKRTMSTPAALSSLSLYNRNRAKNMKQFNNFLEDDYRSLADIFKLAPKGLGFNVEIKYPVHAELMEDGIENTVNINDYVDCILQVVFDNASEDHAIIFSSFHPDICMNLALKQPQFPVCFLTEAGKKPKYDIRCCSLKNAIRFAKSAQLFGVVSNVRAILEAPQLIDIVHKNGLILLTYGQQNNDTKIIDLQMEYGIDGVISDHVQYVRAHLDSKKMALQNDN